MKKFILQKLITIGISAVILLGAVQSSEGYTTDSLFYDGIDLETGIIEHDDSMFVLVAGDVEQIKYISEINQGNIPLTFSPSIDLHFELGLEEEPSIISPVVVLKPAEDTKLAVLKDTFFANVDYSTIQDIQFINSEDFDEKLTSNDTVVLSTSEGNIFKLGNIVQSQKFIVSLDYQKLTPSVFPTPEPTPPSAVPEASTFILFGVGLLLIIGIVGRNKRRQTFFSLMVFLGLFALLVIGASPLCVYAIEIGEIAPEDQDVIEEYIGENIASVYGTAFYIEGEGYKFVQELVGSPIEYVQKGFPSKLGEIKYYQEFETGVILTPCAVESAGCVIYQEFYTKWKELGFNADNPLGAPFNNPFHDKESLNGTMGIVQEFEEGAIVYHEGETYFEEDPIENDDEHHAVYEEIYEKWGDENVWKEGIYEQSPLGFPMRDVEDAPPSGVTGRAGKMANFQGGAIYLQDGEGEAYEVHGLIHLAYNETGGPESWLGYPITDEEKNYLGYSINIFEGGYITSFDDSNYEAFKYMNDAKSHIEVFDFWRKADPIANDPRNLIRPSIWVPNFDAQFKVRNVGIAPILIEKLGLRIYEATGSEPSEILSDGGYYMDLEAPDHGRRHDENIILRDGENHHFTFSDAMIGEPGTYWLVAAAQIRGCWYRLDWMEFNVLGCWNEPETELIPIKLQDTVLDIYDFIRGLMPPDIVSTIINLLIRREDDHIVKEVLINRNTLSCEGYDPICTEIISGDDGAGDGGITLLECSSIIPIPIVPLGKTVDSSTRIGLSYDLSAETRCDNSSKVCGEAKLIADVTYEEKSIISFPTSVHTVFEYTQEGGDGTICYNPVRSPDEALCIKTNGIKLNGNMVTTIKTFGRTIFVDKSPRVTYHPSAKFGSCE